MIEWHWSQYWPTVRRQGDWTRSHYTGRKLPSFCLRGGGDGCRKKLLSWLQFDTLHLTEILDTLANTLLRLIGWSVRLGALAREEVGDGEGSRRIGLRARSFFLS
jgi:hypothetical protein